MEVKELVMSVEMAVELVAEELEELVEVVEVEMVTVE